MKYTVSMLVGGMPVRKVSHNGKTYLPVEAGTEFVIRVENHTRERVAAVVSVDGLSVLDGEQASHESPGYVVDPGSYVDIEGWRRSEQEVAAFEVKGPSEAGYSEQMGHGRKNVGVIGCVIIPERRRPVRPRGTIAKGGPRGQSLGLDADYEREELTSGGIVLSDAHREKTGDSMRSRRVQLNAMNAAPTRQDASAGYGRKVDSHSYQVQFDRDLKRKQVISLYYDTVDALVAKGVPVEVGPDPFPLSQRDSTARNLLAT